MKKQILLFCLVFIAISLRNHQLPTQHQLNSQSFKEFCWRDSYGRGVGKVPGTCTSNQDKIGLLCYEKCGTNMKRVGYDCHSVCPSNMNDQGLFCRLEQYGRGDGYEWRPSDGFSKKGMRKRCENDHGSGKCQKWGAVYYPKCKEGYNNAGCCICRPETPDCNKLNLGGRLDLSCAKKINIGDPKTANCASGDEKQAGLCYKACKSGYKGLGPVCWGKSPSNWVECGMGSASSQGICGQVVFNQVSSVGQLAFTIATAGAGAAAEGATQAQKAQQLTKLQTLYKQLKTAYEKNKDAIEVAGAASATVDAQMTNVQLAEGENVTAIDITRLAFQIAAILDPSGVMATVASYTYPKCTEYFP